MEEIMNESKTYTIILADGTRIENLTINGNNFVSEVPIEKSIFEENLTPVVISDGIHMDRHEFMELAGILKVEKNLVDLSMSPDITGNVWLFSLIDVPESELALRKMNSNIQYLSMMTGVDLF